MSPVPGQERQALLDRGGGDERILSLEPWRCRTNRRVTDRDHSGDGHEAKAPQLDVNGLPLRIRQPRLAQKFFAAHHRVVDLSTRRVKDVDKAAGVEVVDENVGVYEDSDRCHARISPRNCRSETRRERRRSIRTYSTLSVTSA